MTEGSKSTSFRDSFAALLEERGAEEEGRHAEPEELVAYRDGELDGAAEERLRDHLAGCRRCTGLLLDLEEFLAPAETPEPGTADLATAAQLRALRGRLAESEAPGSAAGSAATATATATPARPRRSWLPAAVAAILAVAVAGLSFEVVRLRSATAELRGTVAELAAPRLDLPIVYLDPPARSDPEAAAVELGAGVDRFVLVLTPAVDDPAGGTPAGGFEVEIFDPGELAVWRADGLRPSRHGTLRILMSSEVLPPGEYRVRIAARDGDRRVPAGSYPLIVRGASP